ncbi:uncharacterized protein RBU33_016016 isoform 1-T1 [Hipposideros larvatus]
MGRVRRDTCTQPPSVVLHVGTPPPSVCVEETHRHVSLGRLGERLVRGASAEGKGVLTCHHLPCCLSAKHDAQVYGEPIFALEVGWKEITRAMRVSGARQRRESPLNERSQAAKHVERSLNTQEFQWPRC